MSLAVPAGVEFGSKSQHAGLRGLLETNRDDRPVANPVLIPSRPAMTSKCSSMISCRSSQSSAPCDGAINMNIVDSDWPRREVSGRSVQKGSGSASLTPNLTRFHHLLILNDPLNRKRICRNLLILFFYSFSLDRVLHKGECT